MLFVNILRIFKSYFASLSISISKIQKITNFSEEKLLKGKIECHFVRNCKQLNLIRDRKSMMMILRMNVCAIKLYCFPHETIKLVSGMISHLFLFPFFLRGNCLCYVSHTKHKNRAYQVEFLGTRWTEKIVSLSQKTKIYLEMKIFMRINEQKRF